MSDVRGQYASARTGRALAGITMVLLGLVGCGASAPKSTVPLFPTHGKVTLDGTPVGNAVIEFIALAESQGQGGSAVTQADGTYTASTHFGEPGLPSGEYRVTVSKQPTPTPSDSNAPNQTVGMLVRFDEEAFPTAYTDRQTTILTGTVPTGGEATIDFELTSKVKKGASPRGVAPAAVIPPGMAPPRR